MVPRLLGPTLLAAALACGEATLPVDTIEFAPVGKIPPTVETQLTLPISN